MDIYNSHESSLQFSYFFTDKNIIFNFKEIPKILCGGCLVLEFDTQNKQDG